MKTYTLTNDDRFVEYRQEQFAAHCLKKPQVDQEG